MDNVLKVLVVSMGAPDPEGDKLRHDLSLVRSAALYADQVTLMSAGAELLMGYQDMLANADDESVWQLLGRAPELRDQVGRLPDVSAALQEIAERIRRSDGIWRDEYQEFDLGRQAGVVKIEPFTAGAWTQREEDGEDGSRFLARLG